MTVFDVAKYVLHRTGQLTTMKLEKLVYYCQAWSLAWDGFFFMRLDMAGQDD